MPHKHVKAQTGSAEITFISLPRSISQMPLRHSGREQHVHSGTAKAVSRPSAHSHHSAQHSRDALADKVPPVSKLPHLAYSMYALLCGIISQSICFPIRHTTSVHQASQCVLQPNGRAQSCAVSSTPTNSRNFVGSLGV